MPFVKLDCGILDSTLWIDREAREIFLTALLMGVPHETKQPTAQLEVRSLDAAGWSAPPGHYGFVAAAGPGIVRRAGLDQEAGLAALERLGRPEAESRSQEHDGRRMIRVDGGYLILNFDRYRQKDHTAADRSQRYRNRLALQRDAVASRVTGSSVTQAEAEAEAEAEQESRGASAPTTHPANGRPKPERATRLPPDFALTDERREIAMAEGLDPDRTFARFCDYWKAAAGAKARKLDWDATWRNWCRTDADRGGRAMGCGGPRAKTVAELEAEEQARANQRPS